MRTEQRLIINQTINTSDLCDALDDTNYDDARAFFAEFAAKLVQHDQIMVEIAYLAFERALEPKPTDTATADAARNTDTGDKQP